MLMEKPNRCMTAKVVTRETGMVSDGMMTARPFCRNSRMTNMTKSVVSTNVFNTSSTEADT